MPDALEERTQAIGRELFAGARRHRPLPLGRAWLDDLAMGWSMRDERVKNQLFRFIDALPGLQDAPAVHRHVHEYLAPVVERFPRPLAWLIRALAASPATAAPTSWAMSAGAHRLARRFIIGHDAEGTVAAVGRLRARGRAATVDLLGEAVLSEAEADGYQARYLALVEAFARAAHGWRAQERLDASPAGPLPRANISIKLSALTGRFEPCDPAGTSGRVRARLRPNLRAARDRGVFVNIDMEQSAYRGATLAILREALMEEAFRDWRDVGVAIQAYLRETPADLEELHGWAAARGAPIWVRLVKGAYWDYERAIAEQNGWEPPVFDQKHETDAAYERLAAWLIERRAVLRPAFASHNIRSIARVLALLEQARAPQRLVEFQMLFGMADNLQGALVDRGERLRVYAPFGELLPGMAYLVRRLLENTSNQSFVRVGFLEHQPEEHLLMDPMRLRTPAPTAAIRFANEPPLDFSLASARAGMAAALEASRSAARPRRPLVIAGRPVESGDWLASRDPSHAHVVVGEVAAATPEQAQAAVAAAAEAFPAWRDAPASARIATVRLLAEVLARRRLAAAALIVRETGKSWREADGDVCEAIDFCRYYASRAERIARTWRVDLPGEENDWIHEPRGVAVVIAPWNFPLAILCGMSVAALVVGNTVVLKPAEQSALVGAMLMDAFIAAGVPAGVANLVTGVGEEVGPALINHPATAVVAFTGSRAVGLMLNRQAAEAVAGRTHVVKVIAELGGKNAIIVDDDADLDEAVQGVMASAFGYQGQKCSACSRAIVLDRIHDRFLQRLVEATRAWPMAPAEDPVHGIGPLIDEAARARVAAAIARGRTMARLAYAGDAGALANEGHYLAPHIFADVPPESMLAQEEIFGPVLSVLRARDLDQALAIADGTDYALTGGCYSRSPANLARVRREFRVGNLYLNRRITGALVGRQPFGGFKLSGGGTQAGGPDYLLNFTNPRTITENTMRHGFAPGRGGEA